MSKPKSKDAPQRLTLSDIPKRVQETFWDRVSGAFEEGDRCWEWAGAYSPRSKKESHLPPRPIVKFGPNKCKRKIYAYRVAYLLVNGSLPRRLLRHTCNNERCCNPAHLVPSTKSRNEKDKYTRLRGERGCKSETCCDRDKPLQEVA